MSYPATTKYASYIALGSNLAGRLDSNGNPHLQPKEWLDFAVASLDKHGQIKNLTASDYVQSQPIGPQNQPTFYNACVRIETTLDALALLRLLQSIEKKAGRVKHRHWGERTLDLDLLHHIALQKGHKMTPQKGLLQTRNSLELTLPHPQIQHRDFVLVPLGQILQDDWALEAEKLIADLENYTIIK